MTEPRCEHEWIISAQQCLDCKKIEALRQQLFEQKQLFEDYQKFMSSAAIDANRWRYWRSLYDISTDTDYSAQLIERALTPEELDAAIDAAMKESE